MSEDIVPQKGVEGKYGFAAIQVRVCGLMDMGLVNPQAIAVVVPLLRDGEWWGATIHLMTGERIETDCTPAEVEEAIVQAQFDTHLDKLLESA